MDKEVDLAFRLSANSSRIAQCVDKEHDHATPLTVRAFGCAERMDKEVDQAAMADAVSSR